MSTPLKEPSDSSSETVMQFLYVTSAILVLGFVVAIDAPLVNAWEDKSQEAAAAMPLDSLIQSADGQPFSFLSKSPNQLHDVYVNTLGRSRAEIRKDGGVLLMCTVYPDRSVSEVSVVKVSPGFEEIQSTPRTHPKMGVVGTNLNYATESHLTRHLNAHAPDLCADLRGRDVNAAVETKTPSSPITLSRRTPAS